MPSVRLPKISIVMPVLNRENTIEKAILSVLDQQYPDIELVIIDGGSSDKTLDIIKRYEKQIAYWHSKPDGSNAVAANLGIEMASGELVALLMADDWYEAETLHKIGQAYQRCPDADMFTCGGRIVYWDEKSQCYKARHVYSGARRMELAVTNICFDVAAAICCRFVKKSLFQKIGSFQPFDAQGRHMFSNDKEFLLRALLHRAKNVYVDYVGHNYLASKESSTFGNHQENILRLCHEHMTLAERFLRQPALDSRLRILFRYWYNDQAARLVMYHLLDRQWRAARNVARYAIKQSGWRWAAAFCLTAGKIMLRKCFRILRRACYGVCGKDPHALVVSAHSVSLPK
ncbi:PGL/p-HBAD biosynthesis glycosyltransferase [Aquicella siphonis]|uniref:PGL/p-HBAD biosynthesis glycosyltransferase n=1 Tax=Aquicella siphonis TaxID=254247 RepID=A0A5E4PJ65_9COXI|nr:glycosyltransferase [Aquicella siphonis]VVC76498.1 PGL/p-HBAD biosynthesis glycosyltransferase [Aquicella siphonis]